MSTRVFGGLEQKREAPPGEKPEPVRTHLRSMIIVPEMIGSIIGVYDGKTFSQVEIKPEMISHYQFHTSLLRMEDLVGFGTVERKSCPLLEALMGLLSLLWTSFESCHATLGLAEKSILTSSNLSDNNELLQTIQALQTCHENDFWVDRAGELF
ncbi:hypothetical protein Peur_027675 [Populus x canadensis]